MNPKTATYTTAEGKTLAISRINSQVLVMHDGQPRATSFSRC